MYFFFLFYTLHKFNLPTIKNFPQLNIRHWHFGNPRQWESLTRLLATGLLLGPGLGKLDTALHVQCALWCSKCTMCRVRCPVYSDHFRVNRGYFSLKCDLLCIGATCQDIDCLPYAGFSVQYEKYGALSPYSMNNNTAGKTNRRVGFYSSSQYTVPTAQSSLHSSHM